MEIIIDKMIYSAFFKHELKGFVMVRECVFSNKPFLKSVIFIM